MRRPLDVRRRALSLVTLVAAVALVSCGADDENARKRAAAPVYDADALAKQASGPNRAARSGRIDARVTITVKGVREFAEPVTATISGPFRYRKDSALPDYEIEMGLRDYGAELSSLRARSWISLGSTGFELPAAVRRRLVRSSAKGANGLTRTLEQFGIAPWRWETNRRIAGTERIDGVEVVRVATGVNFGRVLRDANTLLGLQASLGITRATGVPPVLAATARRVLAGSVTAASGASWIGVADRVLHKAAFTLTFAVAERDRAKLGGVSAGTIAGELNVSQVGRPQRIAAPETIGRFADFAVGLDALGDAQDAR